MTGRDGVGTLILSIDLELGVDHHDESEARRLDSIRNRLIALTREFDVCATWAVADPVLSAASEPILASNPRHEIAVLGDQAWIGPGCGRVRLRRELTRRFTAARKAGIPVRTLALRNAVQVGDLDLLLEHGVTALRGPAGIRADTAAAPARFGLWQPTPARHLSAYRGWWLPAGWLIRRDLKRVMRSSGTLHLNLDVATLTAVAEPTLHLAARVLRYASQQEQAGRLRMTTINRLAAAALAEREATPSRSILRPAA